MFIGEVMQPLAKDASSYRGNIEHYRARLAQFTYCGAIQG